MKNNSYDIILLVIASRSDIYDKFIHIYWKPFIKYLKEKKYKIKVFLIFGNDIQIDDLELSNEDIIVNNTQEKLVPGILIKTVESFKYIEENYEYKHILRTNLSSFFIVDNLIKVSKTLQTENIYAAIIGNYNNILFCAGAGFWLSRDNILFILNNENKLDFTIIDDISIGFLMKEKKKTKLNRYDLVNNINHNNKKELLNYIITNNHYHIRIKNSKNRLIDLEYFKEFTEILYK